MRSFSKDADENVAPQKRRKGFFLGRIELVLGLMVLLTTLLPTSCKYRDAILWSADHETGDFSQWQVEQGEAVFTTGTGRVNLTNEVAHSGNNALKLTVTDTQNEQQAARIFRTRQTQPEAYYSAWYYFPQAYETNADWWNVFQFKSKVPFPGSDSEFEKNDAVFAVNVDGDPNEGMRFYLYHKLEGLTFWQERAFIPIGKWTHIEVYYKISSVKTGRVTVWQDGVKIIDAKDVQTRYPNGTVDWSLNNYTREIWPDNPATLYVDDAFISRRRLGPNHDKSLLQRIRLFN